MTWKPVGGVLPTGLAEANLEIHWAAQLVSAPGTTWLSPQADFSHTNLGWDRSLGVLVGRTVAEHRAALVFESLELVVLGTDRERAALALPGQELGAALAWLGMQMGTEQKGLTLPSHDMPTHAVAEGGTFTEGDPDGRRELARWFSNAYGAIEETVADERDASTVRCWPHHFDLASLVVIDVDTDSETARSIGIGFSPGDGSYGQPYFYVNPWPYPPASALPPREGAAHWHTEGWTGAVLTAEHILAAGETRQARLVAEELRTAVAACRALLTA